MKLVVNVPDEDISALDFIAQKLRGQYYKRSDCVRDLIREYIVKNEAVVKAPAPPVKAGIPGVDFIPAELPRVKRICMSCKNKHCSTCDQGNKGASPGLCECECGGLTSIQYLGRIEREAEEAKKPKVVQEPYVCSACRNDKHEDCKHGGLAKGIFRELGEFLDCRCEECVEARGE